MSFPRYDLYKNSGIEWLGEVPAHWKINRLKLIADVFPSNVDKKEYADEVAVRLCNYTDVYYNDVITADMELMKATATQQQVEKFTLRSGDIVLTKDSETADDIAIAAYVPEDLPGIVCGYHLSIARPKPAAVGAFIKRVFDAVYLKAQAEVAANGLTRVGLSQYALDNLLIAYPDRTEQSQIAHFLNQETSKIDVLIDQQRHLIELLKEKRQTVISHAVTKGVNPSCTMKASGVGWLGNIPASWDIVGSRRLFRMRNERACDSDQQLTASQKYGMLFQSDFVELEGRRVVEVIQGTDTLRHVEPNDFVISLRSFQGGIEWSKLAGSVTFHYVVLTPIKDVHPPFFAYLFKSLAYIQALRSTTNLIRDGQDLRYSHFVLLDLPIVPLDEQREIASYLDKKIPEIDALRAEAQAAIERLQERRSALISAAVTGKIDVRFSMRKGVVSVKPYTSAFAHQVLAAKILANCNDSHMGRTKLQKLIHVTEYHAQIEDLRGNYTRKMAGPLNMKAMISLEQGLEKQSWYKTVKSDKRYRYIPLDQPERHSKYMDRWSDKAARIDQVLSLMGNMTMHQCEIVSTLYAAWNDLLIDQLTATDEAILAQASTAEGWHKKKEHTPREKWVAALGWMKKVGLVPTGFGTHTRKVAPEDSHEPA
jgi:type I restriction enzyme S subunit